MEGFNVSGTGECKEFKIRKHKAEILEKKIRLLSLHWVNRCDIIAFTSQMKTISIYSNIEIYYRRVFKTGKVFLKQIQKHTEVI